MERYSKRGGQCNNGDLNNLSNNLYIYMNKSLHLFKDTLMKRKRTITDDDLFVEGMYHPLLDTKTY